MIEPNVFDDAMTAEVRRRFANVDSDPFTGSRIYLESAGGSLTLKSVLDAVVECTALPDNAARDNASSKQVDAWIAQGLSDVALLLGAKSGTVAVAESTTANAFKTLGAMVREVPGTNVVTTNLDHPSIYDATRILADRHGKEWRVAELTPDTGTVTPEAVVNKIDRDTTFLAIIHSSNILGTTNDVGAVISAAREVNPDLFVVVDGSQHLPHGLVDVEQMGCDAYLASSYKTFGKPGASVVWLSERASRLPHDRLLGKPETYWEWGTRETAGYAAWSRVVEYLKWLGGRFMEADDPRGLIAAAYRAIGSHERALTSCLLRGVGGVPGLLDIPGVTMYGETDDMSIKDPAGVFSVAGVSAKEMVSRLGAAGIIVHTRLSDAYSKHTLQALGISECVRVSMAHYNTPAEVEAFLRCVSEEAKG